MVCNMTGQNRERWSFPIIVDAGASASVMPTDWCNHTPIEQTPGSEAGELFRAANDLKIPNEGERYVPMVIRDVVYVAGHEVQCVPGR